ncbi:hypothetical protein B0H14DRAFT_3061424 [Mycena olivaceomarginata]|nr:hypothetical protein B0H14DRAFT_3061424 [Mycena olivaceomarginata]
MSSLFSLKKSLCCSFILALCAALEIWDVMDKQCVWTRHGDARRIVVARTIEDHTLTMAIQHNMTLEILCINVQDWNLVKSMLFPHHDMLRGIKSAHIVGNIMAVHLFSSILLVDWCTWMYIALNGFEGPTYQGVRLLVYPIATFGSAWLLIYESPLQCGTYKIVLYICHQKGGVVDHTVTFRYKCTVCNPGFQWTSSGATPAALSLSVCPGWSTYSGYVWDNDILRVWDNTHPDSPVNRTKTKLFSPQKMHFGLHLSAYSCVVIRVLQMGSVVLSYYL